jgi:hypothetical protein
LTELIVGSIFSACCLQAFSENREANVFTAPDIQSKARLGKTTRMLLLFGSLSAVAFAFLVPTLSLGINHDAASFLVVAQRWLNGSWPYVGTFDNKPPLFYVLMLPTYLLSLMTGAALAIAASWAAWCGALGVALYALLRRLGLPVYGAVFAAIAVTILSANPQLSEGGGYSETPAAVFLVLACWLALRPGHRSSLAAGLCFGASVSISTFVIPFGVLVAASFWLSQRRFSLWLRAGLWAIAGATLLIMSEVSILALTGTLGTAIYDVIDYGRAYLLIRPCSLLTDSGWPCGYSPLANLWSIGGSVVAWSAFALLGFALLRRQLAVIAFAMLWLILFVALVVESGRLLPHYALVAVVPLAMLAGLGFEALHGWRYRIAKLGLLGVGLGMVFLCNAGQVLSFPSNDSWIGVSNQRSVVLARWLQANTGSNTPYWLWDSTNTYVYLLLPRQPLDPNVNLYGLVTPGWATSQMGSQLACSLASHEGLIIEDVTDIRMPGLLTMGDHPYWANILDPVRILVRDHYHQIGQIDGFIIYAPLPNLAEVAGCP